MPDGGPTLCRINGRRDEGYWGALRGVALPGSSASQRPGLLRTRGPQRRPMVKVTDKTKWKMPHPRFFP
jgi:hypothetical protein